MSAMTRRMLVVWQSAAVPWSQPSAGGRWVVCRSVMQAIRWWHGQFVLLCSEDATGYRSPTTQRQLSRWHELVSAGRRGKCSGLRVKLEIT